MIKLISKLFAHTSSFFSIYQFLGGTWVILVTALSSYLAITTAWISNLGYFVIFMAILVGILLSGVVVIIFYELRKKRLWLEEFDKWKVLPRNINPLNDFFTKERININSFSPPLPDEMIEGKTFINCELCGPSVVAFMGNTLFHTSHFIKCDFVKIKNGIVVKNILVFNNVTIKNCKLYRLTILIPENSAATFDSDMNVQWITN